MAAVPKRLPIGNFRERIASGDPLPDRYGSPYFCEQMNSA